jgi:transposase
MQMKTILNRVQKFKSFVYKSVSWVESQESPVLEVTVVERPNQKPTWSGCGCQ